MLEDTVASCYGHHIVTSIRENLLRFLIFMAKVWRSAQHQLLDEISDANTTSTK